MNAMFIGMHWLPAKDGDPRAYALMTRHYSFHPYRDGRRQDYANRNRHLIVGPGEKMVLLTVDCDALFVWRKFIDASGQCGVCCAVFHSESGVLSSALILEAELLAWARWPGERLYTYVNAGKIKSANPGFCFKCAGWRVCGHSGSGLVILEKYPATCVDNAPGVVAGSPPLSHPPTCASTENIAAGAGNPSPRALSHKHTHTTHDG